MEEDDIVDNTWAKQAAEALFGGARGPAAIASTNAAPVGAYFDFQRAGRCYLAVSSASVRQRVPLKDRGSFEIDTL